VGPSLLYCQCCHRVFARAFFVATLGGAAGERASSLVRDASPIASHSDNGAVATDGTRDATTLWSWSPGGCCCRPGESLDGARRAVAPSCPGSFYLETRSQPIADGECGCRSPALCLSS